MPGISPIRTRFLLISALLISGLGLLVTQKSYADPLQTLKAGLPDRVDGWRAEQGDRIYDERTIFGYIDGAGEVYRSYNMRMCLSRRYTIPNGPALVLDIFDMGSPEDAFGVFTHDLEGESLAVGQEALYRAGWLSFWKDRFFISIYTEAETAASRKALRELGIMVSEQIPARGMKPALVLRLPPGGLRPGSVRFLHDQTVLNYHFYVSDEDILFLGPQTDAVLAVYDRAEEYGRLLLVSYPDAGKAEVAFASFLKNYLPDADPEGMVLLENEKWAAARFKDKLVAIVLEADSRALARILLNEATISSSPGS